MHTKASHPVRVQQMAAYNGWATQRLYGHVDALSDADYRRDAGLFFKSVHGTLNHLLVGEHLLWYERFAHGASPKVALGAQVEADRLVLRQRLLDGAARWPVLLAGFADSRFEGELTYTRMSGDAVSLPFAATLLHVFNHGTHHRAQITAALTAMGRACPELDMVFMLHKGGGELAQKAAAHHRGLRALGITVRSAIDVLVASFCIERGYVLLHRDRDRDFDAFEDHRGLRAWAY